MGSFNSSLVSGVQVFSILCVSWIALDFIWEGASAQTYFEEKNTAWDYILNIITQVQDYVVCPRPCLLFCVNSSQNAFRGWLAENISRCKLSEQALSPFYLGSAIRGGGFLLESWPDHWSRAQCKVQREQSVPAQTQLEYCFEFLLWTWLCSGCKPTRKWWISNMQFSSWVISDQISEIRILQ